MSVKIMGVVWDAKLKPTEKFILLAYADHADHDGTNIFPAVRKIVEKTGFSERTVRKATRELERLGWLVSDGEGPQGTNRWRIPLDMGGAADAPPKEEGAGDSAGGCSNRRGGVQEMQERGAGDAPKPSLTVIDSSEEPLINAHRALSEYFVQVTGIPWLDPKTKSGWAEARRIWNEPLQRILDMVDGNLSDAKALVCQAVRRLRKNGMTIASPGSIEKTCRAIMGEVASGAFRLEMSVAEMVDLVYQKMEE